MSDISEDEHVHSPEAHPADAAQPAEAEDPKVTIENLRAENAFLDTTMRRLKQELAMTHDSATTLADELEKASAAMKELKRKLVASERAREQTSEINEEIEVLKEQLNALQADNAAMRKKLKKTRDEKDHLEKSLAEQSSQATRYQEECSQLKQQLQRVTQTGTLATSGSEANVLATSVPRSPGSVPASPPNVSTEFGSVRKPGLVSPLGSGSPGGATGEEEIEEDDGEDTSDWFEERNLLLRELEQCNFLIDTLRQENDALKEQATAQQLALVHDVMRTASATNSPNRAARHSLYAVDPLAIAAAGADPSFASASSSSAAAPDSPGVTGKNTYSQRAGSLKKDSLGGLNPQEIPPEGLSAFAKKQNRKSAALVRFSVLSQDLENEMGRRSRGGSFNTATASGAVKFAPEVGTSDASAALQKELQAEKAKLAEATTRLQQVEQQLGEARRKEEEAKARLAQQDTQRHGESSELKAYAAKEAAWAAAEQAHKSEKDTWQRDLEAARAQNASLQKELAALQATLAQQKRQSTSTADVANQIAAKNKYSLYGEPTDENPLSGLAPSIQQAEKGVPARTRTASEVSPLLTKPGKQEKKSEGCCCNVM